MHSLDFVEPVVIFAKLYVLAMALAIICLSAFYLCGWIVNMIKRKPKQDDNGERSTLHQYPTAITGNALQAQMNEAYFDALFPVFVRGLRHAGYKLSAEGGPAPRLPRSIFDALACEIERARQMYMTGPDAEIEDDIRSHMQSGRAQKHLMHLIASCERLGWNVIPFDRSSE